MNPTTNVQSSFKDDFPSLDEVGYALDYPLHADLYRLTYEELHTLNVLVKNTIDVLNGISQPEEQFLKLKGYIDQYRKEGRLIYHLICDYLPHQEVRHNVVAKLTQMITSNHATKTNTLNYFKSISDGLSKVLDIEFQYIAIHPKIMA